MDTNLLKRLCIECGVSGDEDKVREIILEEIKPFVNDIKVDAMGNITVLKKGKKRPKQKLLMCAHMDEVGFIITYVCDDGALKFNNVGNVAMEAIPGKHVLVGKKHLNGVIGLKPIHLQSDEEKNKELSVNDLYIDIGASSKEEALKYVTEGDTAYFKGIFDITDDIIKSKALDDRIGCCVLIEIIKSELMYDTYFVFTVQEEVGLKGSTVAAYNLKPDSAIVIDATTASDIANVDKKDYVCSLNKGAVITFMDEHTIYNKDYFNLAKEVAEKNGIKYQIKKSVTGGNDSGAIHKSCGGVKTIAISNPSRYLHSSVSLASLNDIKSVKELAIKMAEEIAGTEV